jgi:proline racemase
MRSSKVIHVVSCHAEGEVGDVIVGGVAPPPGATLWDQRDWLWQDQGLRRFLLNEPRGGVFRHVNLLVPPRDPRAAAGFIIMEPEDNPPMSGSNSISVATVLLDTGLVPMVEPVTNFVMEAPGGLVAVRADCAGGKARRIHVQNLPSFAGHLGAALDVPGLGRITVDTAYGGDSFVVVDAAALGFTHAPDEAHRMAVLGVQVVAAADAQIPFVHPENPAWSHYSFCLFAGGLDRVADGWETRHAVCVRPGKIDRSPTGTAVSARLALMAARGQITNDQVLRARSIIGGVFEGRIVARTAVGDRPAVRPEISGRAWITGTHQHMLDPDDPWPEGYRLSDTWGARGGAR